MIATHATHPSDQTLHAYGLNHPEALRERRRLPIWLWPAVACGLLILGIFVGWRLNAGARADQGGSASSEKLASAGAHPDQADEVRRPTVASGSRHETDSVTTAPRSKSGSRTRTVENSRIASNSDSKRRRPSAEENEANIEPPTAKPKTDVNPSLPMIVAAPEPEPKPDAELTPDELLERRGLTKNGSYYCIPEEFEVEEAYNRAEPFWMRTEAAWTAFATAWDNELTWQNLDVQRINLQSDIGDRANAMNSMPNTLEGRVTRVQLQQEQQLAQLLLAEINRNLTLAARLRPAPRELEVSKADFLTRRQAYQAESENLRRIFVKVLQRYAELQQDDLVTNAIKILSRRASAPMSLGPSKYFKTAQTNTTKRLQILSDDPDAYRRRRKHTPAASAKGKKQSMPSTGRKKQD
jgi:hypothetical protein